ncbi:NDR1/HIN1-like protein 13 [Gastrolobium bilobum]|uniref:NDR1/HIN1-like protein 13 n=1 Tax=Gastrolobium bilobum TaxID=150636 RepID=UPI002AB0A891|nr:NDR1/HIN1-like protein 13 [Gastrolobium bilobum]
MSRRETNPHFSRPPRAQLEDQDHVPLRAAQFQDHSPMRPQQEDHQRAPILLRGAPGKQQEDYQQAPISQRGSSRKQPKDHQHAPIPLRGDPRKQQEDHQRAPFPQRGPRNQQEDQAYPPGRPRVNFQEPSSSPKAAGFPVQPPPEPRRHERGIRLPQEQKSKPLTWLGGLLCAIFFLVIIIGGLIVLIVYLVFRPQSPHFDVSSVTLNAAYLDFGYLLNADLTLLANFTNPNKKVHVDFSSVTIYLYYGSTLIASQYVEPFSAARVQSRFANIHMVTSQVQLPIRESQRLVKQMESNGVLLEVTGVFRARSKLGSVLRYSYNLYSHCNIMVTRPPDGVLLKKKCRTKR